ncbi:MAG: hypothetical protein ABIY55_05980 [Kofleriaceae bacterium]
MKVEKELPLDTPVEVATTYPTTGKSPTRVAGHAPREHRLIRRDSRSVHGVGIGANARAAERLWPERPTARGAVARARAV